jgi:hypothetical protein
MGKTPGCFIGGQDETLLYFGAWCPPFIATITVMSSAMRCISAWSRDISLFRVRTIPTLKSTPFHINEISLLGYWVQLSKSQEAIVPTGHPSEIPNKKNFKSIRGRSAIICITTTNGTPKTKKRPMKKSIYTLFNILLFASIIAVGCSVVDSDPGPETSEVRVQMQMQTAASTGTGQLMASQQLMNYDIREVKLYIDEMELESISEDSSDFEDEDFIVNLPLDGSAVNISQRNIQPGLYDEFELEVERPEDDVTVSDPDFVDGDENYSVVVKGLYNGEEFTYRSREDFEIEMELNPPLEVSESEVTALVVNIDVDCWFKDSNGDDLDPFDSNNFDRIDENIENSFEGYKDESDDDDDGDDNNDDD